MGDFLLNLVLIGLIVFCFMEPFKWNAPVWMIIVGVCTVIYLIDDESAICVAVVAGIVLPWRILKGIPGKRSIYFTSLAILLIGNGVHFAWVVSRNGDGGFTENLGRALVFVIVFFGSIVLFNIAALLVRSAHRRKYRQ